MKKTKNNFDQQNNFDQENEEQFDQQNEVKFWPKKRRTIYRDFCEFETKMMKLKKTFNCLNEQKHCILNNQPFST